MSTALVIGNYLPSLAAVRSLAAAGYRVISGDGGEYSPAPYSRHSHESWVHPPIERREPFLDALTRLLESRPDISVVLPLRGRYVELLAASRERLPDHVVVASPQPDVVLACIDKERMYELAKDAGVPHRPLRVVQDATQLAEACAELGLPCVVRPVKDTDPRLPRGRKAFILRDASAMEEVFLGRQDEVRLLVQPFVAGPRHNVFFAASEGALLAQLQTRVLRTDRVDGFGLAVEGVTTEPDARLTAYTAALIERVGYTGIGFAQFLVPHEGVPHFLELNPRHAGSTAITDHCGLDLTEAAVALATRPNGWEPGPVVPCSDPRRYVWTSRELFSIRLAWSRREMGTADALAAVGHALRTALDADCHLTWSMRDPLPTMAVLMHLARGPWRRVATWSPGVKS